MRARGLLRGLALCLVASIIASAASGQQIPVGVLVVDRERVFRDSAPAMDLADAQRKEQDALRGELDALRLAFEAEEEEIARFRETATREDFEARVRDFDIRVREARLASQRRGEALQRRYDEARARLTAALGPILLRLLEETGAAMILDARSALIVNPRADATDEAIRRLNALPGSFAPPPVPAEPQADGG